jgi:hypothetical protein
MKEIMKKIVLLGTILGISGFAQAGDMPSSGLTGLWRFQTSADKLKATIGTDMTTSDPGNSTWMVGPWTVINPGWSDNGIVQETSWKYLSVNPNFTANGGGSYVNQYTVMIDYVQTSGVGASWNSLFQTSWGGNDSDGDLWIAPDNTIGVGDVGYSSQTFNPSTWHRIVWSVDNSSFFKVYVDGQLFLNGAGQGTDGRFSLYPDRFNLFADDSWEDQWGLVGTAATWDRALTGDEIAGMGGWIAGAAEATPLTVPEPGTLSLLALGGLALLRRNRH